MAEGFDLSYEQMKRRLGGLVGKHCTVLVYPSHDRDHSIFRDP